MDRTLVRPYPKPKCGDSRDLLYSAPGQLRPGLAADLVLLSKNPLQNTTNSTTIEGVMIRGRWMDKRMREAGLADIARRNGGSLAK